MTRSKADIFTTTSVCTISWRFRMSSARKISKRFVGTCVNIDQISIRPGLTCTSGLRLLQQSAGSFNLKNTRVLCTAVAGCLHLARAPLFSLSVVTLLWLRISWVRSEWSDAFDDVITADIPRRCTCRRFVCPS